MENKKFYEAFVAGIKKELSNYAQKQKDLKKLRKLENRPKDRSLSDIQDAIMCINRPIISTTLFYYTWLKHSKKYWANRNVYSLKDYYQKYSNCKFDWDKPCHWRVDMTIGDYYIERLKNWVDKTLYDDNFEDVEYPDSDEWFKEAFLKIQ